jgi:hypothetical protein
MIELDYDAKVDVARVWMREPINPEDIEDSEQLDADRFVRYDAERHALTYEFINARRFGVRLDDLEHRVELATLFRDAGFQERDWSHPISTNVIHRRDRAAG